MMTFKLRPYQEKIVARGHDILKKHGLLYLAMEVRTGKTLTSLSIGKALSVKSVLFITKKLCIDNGNIVDDFNLMGGGFDLTMSTNHHLTIKKKLSYYDLIIVDEAHCFGAYPKASAGCKSIKNIRCKYMILMSGTPSPESYSQLFHQFYMTNRSPFNHYNFYKWAKGYVNVKQRKIGGFMVNDYSDANKKEIFRAIERYMITYTQKEAGFNNEIVEKVHNVTPSPELLTLLKQVKNKELFELPGGTILMDSAANKLNKYRQMCGGAVITEGGLPMMLDTFKAEYIRDNFKGKKLLIFYYYQAECEILKYVLGDSVTESLAEFRATDKSVIKQIRNGREGVSYKEADEIVFYSIDYSATSYWQARDRLTTKDSKKTVVNWLFTEGGVEPKVYKAILSKKSYTTSHFIKDVLGK